MIMNEKNLLNLLKEKGFNTKESIIFVELIKNEKKVDRGIMKEHEVKKALKRRIGDYIENKENKI